MKKKIIAAVLALMLCFSFAAPAFAASAPKEFIIDEFGIFTAEELKMLNKLAREIYQDSGVGLFFVFTGAEQLADYDLKPLLNGIEDYAVMLENESYWTTYSAGSAYLDSQTEDVLRGVYDECQTYVEGVEAYLLTAAEMLILSQSAPAVSAPEKTAPDVSFSGSEEYLIYDTADLLTDSEEAALTDRLMEISKAYQAQLIVATIESLDGADIDDFLNDAYDEMGFGYGEEKDGAFLLVCMDPRAYRILTNGFAGVAIDSNAISRIGDVIVSDLSAGNYADAFGGFADQCEYYLDGHINGFPFEFQKNLVICLVIGAVVGLIVVFVLKNQLKTVRKQEHAHVYVKPGSMDIAVSNDIFLYRDVSRTKKSSGSSSSGSSSSRSTGGGSF